MNSYYRDTYLKIDIDTIISNLNEIKTKCSKDKFLYAVIKGNGYGHGIVEMAKITELSLADGVAVATLDEALVVREYLKDIKILCLGLTREQDYAIAAQNNITITIGNMIGVKHATNTKLSKELLVHIKANTGMNRIGFKTSQEINEAITLLNENKMVNVEGIFTHFATAEGEELRPYFDMQFNLFKEMLSEIKYEFKQIHCSNSGALLKHHNEMDFTNTSRVGIALYGALEDDIQKEYDIKSGLELQSVINQVQQYPAGTKIGYSNNYTVKNDSEFIATIPLGYADGFSRLLSGTKVKCANQYGVILGSICMDQMMISFKSEVKPGDIVTLIDLDLEIDIYARAKQSQTITHDVFTGFTSRLPRIYVKNNEIININNSLLKE